MNTIFKRCFHAAGMSVILVLAYGTVAVAQDTRLGAELHSAPILRVNTNEDGTLAGSARRLWETDLRRAITHMNSEISALDPDQKMFYDFGFLSSTLPNIENPAVGALFSVGGDPPSSTDCSGALVGHQWFLTSGHCLRDVDMSRMRVFLPAEGIFEIESHDEFCNWSLAPSTCDPSAHDLTLARLRGTSQVWPALQHGALTVPDGDGRLVGYGSEVPGGTIGLGVKNAISIQPLDNCDNTGLAYCHTIVSGAGAACGGNSGGALLHDDTYNVPWSQGAVAATGGSACLSGISAYLNLSFADHAAWVVDTAQPATTIETREIAWWGLAKQGYMTIEGDSQNTGTDSVSQPNANPQNWPVPTNLSSSEIEIPANKGIELLRVTMNHEQYTLAFLCNTPGCKNKFDLRLTSPSNSTSECACSGQVYVVCNCANPETGVWTIDVVQDTGAGVYQLLALPLGAAGATSPAPTIPLPPEFGD